jgi:hypothetical protein
VASQRRHFPLQSSPFGEGQYLEVLQAAQNSVSLAFRQSNYKQEKIQADPLKTKQFGAYRT